MPRVARDSLFYSRRVQNRPWPVTKISQCGTMHVLRAIFPGLPSDLRGSPYLGSEEELITAGLGSSLKKCLTVTGGGCPIDIPTHLKLFLGKALTFLDEQGHKTASCPVEIDNIKFTKSRFADECSKLNAV